jgi:hypothetical protein
MKPRVGVYLSEAISARLAVAAQCPGVTKSALVEAALGHFLDFGDDIAGPSVDRRLDAISRQLEQLDHNLKIVSEAVALHARFHLAATPPLPAVAQRAACTLGSERFDEFAAQVARRVHLGRSLMSETIERVNVSQDALAERAGKRESQTRSAVEEPEFRTAIFVGNTSEHAAAVREDGSSGNFPHQTRNPWH